MLRRLPLAVIVALVAPSAAGAQGFEGPYPVRLVTLETARLYERGSGNVGLGDARVGILDGRLEATTNTIADVLGVFNAGVKLGAEGRGQWPAVAAGARYYHSVGGLIDSGVRRIAESFSDVTDSDVDVRGWVGFATASWPLSAGDAHAHAGVQVHRPLESRFTVADSVAGGGGSVTFQDGSDVSAMVGYDRQLIDTRLVLLVEAGWSWGLDEPRIGLGLDAGSEDWRVAFGASYPGIETDLASEPRDFVVTPMLSVHRRF